MDGRLNYQFMSEKQTEWTQAVVEELCRPDKKETYQYTQSNDGSKVLAVQLKQFLDKNNHNNLNKQLQKEQIIFSEISVLGQPQKLNHFLMVRVADIKAWQKGVQIWYDPKHITPEKVLDIQRCKAGVALTNKSPFYKCELERLSSYVVVRGETRQIYAMADQPRLLDQPRKRITYYATFPKLQYTEEEGSSFQYFTLKEDKQGKHSKKARDLDPAKIQELKEMFKDVLRLQIQVAANNKEGLDVVTPNAFFYGLTEDSCKQAKQLFYQAVAEVASEQEFQGFQGLFIHIDYHKDVSLKEIEQIFQGARLRIPVVLGTGDAAAPQLAAQGLDGFSITNVADCIMGEGIGCVGNAATKVGKANNAKEEMDTRLMMGLNIAVLDPNYNPRLFNTAVYQSIRRHPLDKLEEKGDASEAASESVNPSEIMRRRERVKRDIEKHLEALKKACQRLKTIVPSQGKCRKAVEAFEASIDKANRVQWDPPFDLEKCLEELNGLLQQSEEVRKACEHLQLSTEQTAKVYRLRGALIGAVVGICASLAVIMGGLVAAPVGGLLAGAIGVTLFGAGIGGHFSASHTFSVAAKIKTEKEAIKTNSDYIKWIVPYIK
ncbi:MAG: hypothetical protein K0R24_1059 [Gammaproteobacteria bacterium]|nr:hypothetical protein [Gammaproteobacteria bacterium]